MFGKGLLAYVLKPLDDSMNDAPKSDKACLIEAVRRLRGCDDDTLELYYNSGQVDIEMATSKVYSVTNRYLWFFSHPTFKVFKRFLQRDDLIEGMYELHNLVLRYKGRSRKWKKSIRKQVRAMGLDTELSREYQKLIEEAYRGKVLYSNNIPQGSQNVSVTLYEKPQSEEIVVAKHEFVTALMKSYLLKIQKTSEGAQFVGSFRESLESCFSSFLLPLMPWIANTFEFPPTVAVKPTREFEGCNIAERTLDIMSRKHIWPRFLSARRVTMRATVTPSPEQLTLWEKEHIPKIFKKVLKRGNLPTDIKEWHRIKNGRLPVGFKVHALTDLGDESIHYAKSWFHLESATKTFIVPPAGNVDSGLELLHGFGESIGVPVINNEDFQIQVCSPGELSQRRAAMLGSAFFLGSDRIRTYDERYLTTSHQYSTGQRLVIYGAGVCASTFDWVKMGADGVPLLNKKLPSLGYRTDVLWAHSAHDINLINLVATLLVHEQYEGYWGFLGAEFMQEYEEIMNRHHLGGVLNAPWARSRTEEHESQPYDELFALTMQELSAYALEEAARLNKPGTPRNGIMAEVGDLIRYCEDTVTRGCVW